MVGVQVYCVEVRRFISPLSIASMHISSPFPAKPVACGVK